MKSVACDAEALSESVFKYRSGQTTSLTVCFGESCCNRFHRTKRNKSLAESLGVARETVMPWKSCFTSIIPANKRVVGSVHFQNAMEVSVSLPRPLQWAHGCGGQWSWLRSQRSPIAGMVVGLYSLRLPTDYLKSLPKNSNILRLL